MATALRDSNVLYGRRKSFEAEDSQGLNKHPRRLTAFQNMENSALTPIPDGVPLSAASSESRLGQRGVVSSAKDDRVRIFKNRSLPRSSFSFGQMRSSAQTSVEVKRNHSWKSFLQKKIPPSLHRSKEYKPANENSALIDTTNLLGQVGDTSKPQASFSSIVESPEMLDLRANSEAIIRPLHYSILGRSHCFEVISSSGSRCFACKSAGERESWMEKLKRIINPNLENSRRVENQLKLWVQEAKGMPVRKKYFCEICLDRQLYARTTSKYKEDSTIFWGEHFDFMSLPRVENVTIHLYKDSEKRRKREKDYVGLINISIKSLHNDQTLEKWYTLSTPSGKSKNTAGETMAMRVKARFQSFCILRTQQYKELGEFISCHYMLLTRAAQEALSVSKKDELSRILVHIMHGTGMIKEFMTEIVMNDISHIEEESLIFRENTVATKAVEHFLKLVGSNYLHETLGNFVMTLYESNEDCEVDGSRLSATGNLDHNQRNLGMCCEIAMCKILDSIEIFPNELREVFYQWRERCTEGKRPRIASKLITASLFLRLLCPAILNPYLFGLSNEIPPPTAARTLTLVAKVIQNLANRSRFGDKEEYMKFMNVFVREQWDRMGRFLNDVTECKDTSVNGFEGYIDIGKELAKLHLFLTANLQTFEPIITDEFNNLSNIVSTISQCISGDTPEPAPRDEVETNETKTTDISSYLHTFTVDAPLSSATEDITAARNQSNISGSKYSKVHVTESSEFEPTKPADILHSEAEKKTGSFNNSNNSRPTTLETKDNHRTVKRIDDMPSDWNSDHSMRPLFFNNPAYMQPHMPDTNMRLSASTSTTPCDDSKSNGFSTNLYQDSHPVIASTHSRRAPPNTRTSNSNDALPLAFCNPLQQFMPSLSSTSAPKGESPIKTDVTDENGSDGNSKYSDDSLSSRPSSTTSDSSVGPITNKKAVKSEVNQDQTSKLQSNHYRDKTSTTKDAGYKLAAVATSTSVHVSNARHCTGLKKRQQQMMTSNSFEKNTHTDAQLASQPSNAKSCQRHFAEKKAHCQRSNRNKYTVPNVEQATVNTRDNIPSRHVPSSSLPKKRVTSFNHSFNTHNKNQSKTTTPAVEDVPRQSHRKLKRSSKSTEEFVSTQISTPQNVMTAEERTAQWVLSNMVPVGKDDVHRANVPFDLNYADNPNHAETVSHLDLDTLTSRLKFAENSNKAFTKREEELLHQLKESDLREARLMERLRVVEKTVAQRCQERGVHNQDSDEGLLNTVESSRTVESGGLQEVINEKNALLSMQQKRIAYLEDTNHRLLNKIKEMKSTQGQADCVKNITSSSSNYDRADEI